MSQKESKQQIEAETLRCRIVPLFMTDLSAVQFPHGYFQTVLECFAYIYLLKFPIDNFSQEWFGKDEAIFSNLDFSYHCRQFDRGAYLVIIAVVITMLTLYWLLTLVHFLLRKGYNQMTPLGSVKKFVFTLLSTVFISPSLGAMLNLYNCQHKNQAEHCIGSFPTALPTIGFVNLILCVILLNLQTLLKYDFLKDNKTFRRIRNSSFTSNLLLNYALINELVFYFFPGTLALLVLNISIILLMVAFCMKSQHILETFQLIEGNLIFVNFLAIVCTDLMYFLKFKVPFSLFLIMAVFSIGIIQQLKTFNLRHELENINKWTTPSMMIRQTTTFRKMIRDSENPLMRLKLYGYFQIHEQKCDNPACPTKDKYEGSQLTYHQIQILKMEALMRKIFQDGFRLTPVNAELQLEFAIFLYETNQKEQALKNLLLTKYQELSFEKYYKYFRIKNLLYREMCERPEKKFLDLVSELEMMRKSEKIMNKFEEAALVNLQFWSVLNEDHPDFQKLNEVGINRVRIGQEVQGIYREISQLVHCEKITNLYVHYLAHLENDEEIFTTIYQNVRKKFNLDQRIVLHDWSNCSMPNLLISLDNSNYGNIIDLNSASAMMFGYEKYEIMKRPLKYLFHEKLTDQIGPFLDSRDNSNFYMCHKNGYTLKIQRTIQKYNSMETGIACLCTLQTQIILYSGFICCTLDDYIIGISASILPLFGFQLKDVEGQVHFNELFKLNIQQLRGIMNEKRLYYLQDLLNEQYIFNQKNHEFLLSFTEQNNFICIEFFLQNMKNQIKYSKLRRNKTRFKFQIDVSAKMMTYFGMEIDNSLHPSKVTREFRQVKLEDQLDKLNEAINYAANITTLRMIDNIIQVIEDDFEDESQKGREGREIKGESQINNLSRKDEQQIFENRTSFEEFITSYDITKHARLVLFLGLLVTLLIYGLDYFVMDRYTNDNDTLFTEIAFESRKLHSMSRQLVQISLIQQIVKNKSSVPFDRLQRIDRDNLLFFNQIKHQGSEPYELQVYINSTHNKTFYSDEFLLAYINYAWSLSAAIGSQRTLEDFISAFQSFDPNILDYLIWNSNITRKAMERKLQLRKERLENIVERHQTLEILMLMIGVVTQIVVAVVLGVILYKMNNEKIKILKVFLGITENEIQMFSSQTEAFLVSLHRENNTDDTDFNDESEIGKLNNNNFIKKKSFKVIKLSRSIYFQILIIPLISQIFLFQTFFYSFDHLSFVKKSLNYVHITGMGVPTVFEGVAELQQRILTGQQTEASRNVSTKFLVYYRTYFTVHYNTYGQIQDFHERFSDLFMSDSCKDNQQIQESCNFVSNTNGTLYIFTDITVKTQSHDYSSDLPRQYYEQVLILAKTHDLLLQKIIEESKTIQEVVDKDLQIALLTWFFAILLITLVYGFCMITRFINTINLNKHMLTLLPVSMARNLPEAKKYVAEVLQESKGCS